MDNTFNLEIHNLASTAIVDLYVLEFTDADGVDQVLRFHAGTNLLRANVVWQGNTYVPLPVKFSELELSGQGLLPRPKVSIANVGGVISAYALHNQDLIGAKVTHKRTFVRFLDAVNFPGGVNATADPNSHFQDEFFFVDQKEAESDVQIDFRLASALDVSGIKIPRRQVIANTCVWRYRGSDCGFTGPALWNASKEYVTLWNVDLEDVVGAAGPELPIFSYQRTSNVALIITNSAHSMVNGDFVIITNCPDPSFNTSGSEIFNVNTTQQFMYNNIGPDVSTIFLYGGGSMRARKAGQVYGPADVIVEGADGLFYRCISANTNIEPGVHPQWQTYWERDYCKKTLTDCKQHHGSGRRTPLPYGGFPGAAKVPQV